MRHTTTAAISIGLPLASLTLIRSLWKLRTRSETFLRLLNGLQNHRPASVTDPTYRPNRVSTRDSLGCTTNTPPRSNAKITANTMPSTVSHLPRKISQMPTPTPSQPAIATGRPGMTQAVRCSWVWRDGRSGRSGASLSGSLFDITRILYHHHYVIS